MVSLLAALRRSLRQVAAIGEAGSNPICSRSMLRAFSLPLAALTLVLLLRRSARGAGGRCRGGSRRARAVLLVALEAVQALWSLRRSPLALLASIPLGLAVMALGSVALPRRVRRLPGLLPPRWWRSPGSSSPATGPPAGRPTTPAALPLPRHHAALLDREVTETDLTRLSWSAAFAGPGEQLAAEYPFTQWKAIDWPAPGLLRAAHRGRRGEAGRPRVLPRPARLRVEHPGRPSRSAGRRPRAQGRGGGRGLRARPGAPRRRPGDGGAGPPPRPGCGGRPAHRRRDPPERRAGRRRAGEGRGRLERGAAGDRRGAGAPAAALPHPRAGGGAGRGGLSQFRQPGARGDHHRRARRRAGEVSAPDRHPLGRAARRLDRDPAAEGVG